MNVNELKAEISLMRAYWFSLLELQAQIEQIEYAEENVRAINYDKIPTSPNPNAEQIRLELVEKKSELEAMIDKTLLKYNPIKYSVINALESLTEENKQILCEKYGLYYEKMDKSIIVIFKGQKTYEELNERYHYSNLWRHIKSEVEKL